MTLHLPVGGAHGVPQRTRIGALEQMGDHFGVGLGGEGVPFRFQLGPQGEVVLHDPVEHDGEAPGAVGVGVGVLVRGATVGGPARVGDTDGGTVAHLMKYGFEAIQVAHRMQQFEPAFTDERDTRRVIASILELPQPPEEDVPAGTVPHVADDPAHSSPFLLGVAAPAAPARGARS